MKKHIIFKDEEMQRVFEAGLKSTGYTKTADCMWAKIYKKDDTEIVIHREW